jgi:hypothetical protein
MGNIFIAGLCLAHPFSLCVECLRDNIFFKKIYIYNKIIENY